MTTFTTHTLDSVAAEGRETLAAVNKTYGFVPNLIGNMIEAPATAKAYLTLGKLFGETSFNEAEQQVILLAVSRYNECEYCMSAHSTAALMKNVPVDVVESIRNDEAIANPKLEALRVFATRVTELRGRLEESQMNELLAAGFDRQQVLEVVLGVAMKTISNYTNHITGTILDDAFSPQAWRARVQDIA